MQHLSLQTSALQPFNLSSAFCCLSLSHAQVQIMAVSLALSDYQLEPALFLHYRSVGWMGMGPGVMVRPSMETFTKHLQASGGVMLQVRMNRTEHKRSSRHALFTGLYIASAACVFLTNCSNSSSGATARGSVPHGPPMLCFLFGAGHRVTERQ